MPPNFKNFKKNQVQPQQATNSPANQQQQQEVQQNQPKQVENKNYGGFWEDSDDKPATTSVVQQTQQKGKPNFLKKEQPPAPAPVQIQQPVEIVPPVQNTVKEVQKVEQKSPQIHKEENKEQIKQQEPKISNIPLSKQFKVSNEFELLQPDQLENPQIQFESKSVDDVIAPGGIRVKQNQNILDEFCYTANNSQTPIIGSLLISKLYSNLPFQQKTQRNLKQIEITLKFFDSSQNRTLYAIQDLIRKQEKYQKYFKHHLSVLKSSPLPDNDPQELFTQEMKLVATLVDNPNATFANEASDVKFEFKSNLLSTVQTKKPSPTKPPQSDTNPVNSANSQNTINLIDDVEPQAEPEQKKKGFDFIKKNKQNKVENQTQPQSLIDPSTPQNQELPQQNNIENKKKFSFLKKQEIQQAQLIDNSPQEKDTTLEQKNDEKKKNAFSFIKKSQQNNQNGNNQTEQNNEQQQYDQTNGNHQNGKQDVTNITNQFDHLKLNGQAQQQQNGQHQQQSNGQHPQQPHSNGSSPQNLQYGQQYPHPNVNGGYSPYGQNGVPPQGFYPPPQYPYGMYPPHGYPYPPQAGYPYPPPYGVPPAGYGQHPQGFVQPPPHGYGHPMPYGYPPYPGQVQGYGQPLPPQQTQEQQQKQEQQNQSQKKDVREDAFNFIKI